MWFYCFYAVIKILMINYICFPFCGELGLSGLNMQIQLMYHMKSKGMRKGTTSLSYFVDEEPASTRQCASRCIYKTLNVFTQRITQANC